MTLTDLENAINGAISAAGIAVGSGSLQVEDDTTAAPVAYVKIDDGTLSRETNDAYRMKATVSISLLFRNVRSPKELRHAIYPVIDGLLALFTLQTLGLSGIKPFAPKGFSNATTPDLFSMGTMLFELQFETSWVVFRANNDQAVDLLRVGLEYFLTPGDAVSDASDLVGQ